MTDSVTDNLKARDASASKKYDQSLSCDKAMRSLDIMSVGIFKDKMLKTKMAFVMHKSDE